MQACHVYRILYNKTHCTLGSYPAESAKAFKDLILNERVYIISRTPEISTLSYGLRSALNSNSDDLLKFFRSDTLFVSVCSCLSVYCIIIFSRPTSFLQKSSGRVSSEKNILNSSVESCRVVWSDVRKSLLSHTCFVYYQYGHTRLA